MTGLWFSLAGVASILLASAAVGFLLAGALFPTGGAGVAERLAWGFATALILIAGIVPVCLAAGIRPNAVALLVTAALMLAIARRLPALRDARPALPGAAVPEGRRPPGRAAEPILWLLIAAGLLLYLLRALTEPMWANDFLAIWGWKGKTIFGLRAVPDWMWKEAQLGFTHPEYPLGLPFLFAGISFMLGRWDDHAMALLYPAVQVATLLALSGWLRRRGAPSPLPLAAAAALSLYEPLYRAFTTGMAEVPLSFFLLLLGTSLADAVDGERGGGRRLALAALGAACLKNEGLFASGLAAALALLSPLPARRRLRLAVLALLPALAVSAAHRALTGPLPLRDFQFGLIASPDFLSRLLLGLRTILVETLLPAWPGILAFAILLAAGRHVAAGNRLLIFAAIPLAVYAVLPAFCVLGPDWLARTAFARTAAALAPLVIAGVALRLGPVVRGASPVRLEP